MQGDKWNDRAGDERDFKLARARGPDEADRFVCGDAEFCSMGGSCGKDGGAEAKCPEGWIAGKGFGCELWKKRESERVAGLPSTGEGKERAGDRGFGDGSIVEKDG